MNYGQNTPSVWFSQTFTVNNFHAFSIAEWIKASQTCMTLSLITLAGANVCLFFYIFHKAFDEDKRLVFVSCALCSLSGKWHHSLHLFVCMLVEEPTLKSSLFYWGIKQPTKICILNIPNVVLLTVRGMHVQIYGLSMGCYRHPILFSIKLRKPDVRENDMACL